MTEIILGIVIASAVYIPLLVWREHYHRRILQAYKDDQRRMDAAEREFEDFEKRVQERRRKIMGDDA